MNNRLIRLLGVFLLASCFALATAQSIQDLHDPPPGEWPQMGRDVTQSRYSPLDQINVDNVSQLTLAWARDLNFRQTHQGTPVVWDGIMYVSTQTGVIALDATNGDLIWTYTSPADPDWPVSDSAPRGGPVVYDGKVFIATRYGAAVALDKDTGEEIWKVQLTNVELNESISTNPIFADGRLVFGPTGADAGGAPGRIIAVDVEDGELLWSFDVVPLSPDHPAFGTWTNPPSWEDGIGGGSAWNAGAYDPVTRTVVYGTGQPTPWDRVDWRRRDDGEPTPDLYTASFVALDIDTGELKWYHQVVPADEWDLDQHTVPIFADITIDGEERRVAILATTTGYVVVIDADTGEFLRGHGGFASRYTIHLGYEDDGTPIIDDSQRLPEEGIFVDVCPGLRWAHIAPGAFSPDTGLLYRPNNDHCISFGARMLPDDWQPGERAWWVELGDTTDEHWMDERLGALTAINPSTGEVVWEFSHFYGHDAGPVVTAGGLVFTSATDRRFRAFNAETGEELFTQVLTAGSRAGTITYAVDGKQYVATLVGMSSAGTAFIPDYDPTRDIPPVVLGNVALFVFSLP